jgi:hypothetical protein
MSYKKVSNVNEVLCKINRQRDDFLLLAAQRIKNIAQQSPPTPVLTGKLVGSTYSTRPKGGVIAIGQKADYAIYVEAKQFQMAYSVQAAKPDIDRLKQRLKI